MDDLAIKYNTKPHTDCNMEKDMTESLTPNLDRELDGINQLFELNKEKLETLRDRLRPITIDDGSPKDSSNFLEEKEDAVSEIVGLIREVRQRLLYETSELSEIVNSIAL